MASREGDVIKAPGFSLGTEVTSKEIMYSMVGLSQKGCTLKPDLGVLEAGTPLQYDAASKKYVKATAPANVVGFLRTAVDTTAPQKLGNIVLGGYVKTAEIPSVTGVSDTQLNIDAMVSALGGVENAQFGYIKF